MSAGRLAWTSFGIFVAASVGGVALLAQVPAEALERGGDSLLTSTTFVAVMLVFGLVGAVVASRLPANPIGWLFLGLSMIESLYELAYGYTHYSLTVASMTGTDYTAWFASWASTTAPALIALAFVHFPDGRPVSRGWRLVGWLCVLAVVPVVAHSALVPGPLSAFPSVRNPFGLEGAGFLRDISPDVLVFATLCTAVVAVLVRFRRSRGVQRQQLKWFAWSAGLLAGYILAVALLGAVIDVDDEGTTYVVAGLLFAVILCLLPVSAGIAILRYRLYDIDLVINRTLVYGALTVLLAAAYLGLVLLLQVLLNPLTRTSDLAVAGSTLAVAALFRPARTRIQAEVDRRFYRFRYDAGRTLETFAHRLRDELDLQTLGADLRHVVSDTMQPESVTLWLRDVSQ